MQPAALHRGARGQQRPQQPRGGGHRPQRGGQAAAGRAGAREPRAGDAPARRRARQRQGGGGVRAVTARVGREGRGGRGDAAAHDGAGDQQRAKAERGEGARGDVRERGGGGGRFVTPGGCQIGYMDSRLSLQVVTPGCHSPPPGRHSLPAVINWCFD
jgi:hypothetical protein